MARLTDTRVASIAPPTAGQVEHPDDMVKGLRLRVGAGGRKAWIVRARAGAKVYNKTLGAYPVLSLGKARDEARKFLEALATEGAPRVDMTFGELADAWFKVKASARERNRSWEEQRRRLEIHVLPSWNDRRLATIRRADVRDLVECIEGEINPNRCLTLIRTLFRYAMERDWIEASPAEGVKKPKDEVSRDRVLDMDEIARVYRAADLLGYPFGTFAKLLVLTGQRRSEVATMRWADIDIEAGTWAQPASANKSARAHLVPLSAPVMAILREIPRLGEYVFTETGKTPISGFSKAKQRLDTYIAAKDAEGRSLDPWVFHDLRRSAATHMVRLGILLEVVSRVLNHAAQGVTGRVYALHSFAPEKRSALDRWAADLMRGMAGEPVGNVIKLGANL